MTAEDYRNAIATLGLTQVGAARFLGVEDRTSRRWASGDSPIPEPVARFLRYMVAGKIKPATVTRILSKAETS